ncbi:MAG TPA: hypothetical protein VGP64_10025 [Polyangia bacterium]|jgi:hypothetical protein
MLSGVVTIAAAPLDRARRALLLGIARVPALGAAVVRRDERLRLQALAGVTTAFALTLLCPGVPFVVAPALFGVVHLAADARYLVLRRGVPHWWGVALAAGCVALFALRALELGFPGRLPSAALEVGFGWGWAVAGAVAGWATTRSSLPARRRAAALIPALAAIGVAALAHPHLARLLFAHLHNLVAIGLWLLIWRQRRRFALPALGLLALAVALLASGAALPYVRFDGPWAARLVDESVFAWPRWMPQRTALGLGLSFVLLQSIHYAVWLSFVPQDDLRGQGTLSFQMSWRSLRRDLPLPLLVVTALAAAAVLGASLASVHRTRQLYMSLASFHGYLELAAGSFLYVRGWENPRCPRPAPGSSPS